jgi:hypothetical protein
VAAVVLSEHLVDAASPYHLTQVQPESLAALLAKKLVAVTRNNDYTGA